MSFGRDGNVEEDEDRLKRVEAEGDSEELGNEDGGVFLKKLGGKAKDCSPKDSGEDADLITTNEDDHAEGKESEDCPQGSAGVLFRT